MLLSRLAGRTYWLGRYLARAEDLARAILAFEQIALDIPGGEAPRWQGLAAVAGIDAATAAGLDDASLTSRMILDRESPSSLLGALHLARENLRRARSLVPSECWQTLNELYLLCDARGARLAPADLGPLLGQAVRACQEIAGQLASGMLRDDGHAFLQLGTYLERADMHLRVAVTAADVLIPPDHRFSYEDVRWMGLLKVVGAHQIYRRLYHARADFESVLDLLLLEPTFPRSVPYALAQIDRELDRLPRREGAVAAFRECWPREVAKTRNGLDRFVGEMLPRLAKLNAAIEAAYFFAPSEPDTRPPGRPADARHATNERGGHPSWSP